LKSGIGDRGKIKCTQISTVLKLFITDFQPEAEQKETDCTCSFKYFEFGHQVGAPFHTKHSIVSVGRLAPQPQPELVDHFAVGNTGESAEKLDVEQERVLNNFR
jgi:hypothetical protein